MNRGKNSTQPHYPYQLPTPRSSTESRVSDTNLKPVSFINPATELECLIKPEHTLQTPRSRTTSLDIPAPLVGPSQPRTHGESAVDNVREFLRGQHNATIQEFQGIGMEEFDKLYDALLNSRLRFDFDAHLKILTIRMPGPSHEEGVWNLATRFEDSMQRQRKACGRKLPWILGTNLESRLEADDGSRAIQSKFLSDITIHNKYNAPLVLVEITHGQTRNDAHMKVDQRMATIPSLLGAIVVNIDESPKYSHPTELASPNDYIDESTWDGVVERAPASGPITHRGHCWMGSIKCSIDIRMKGEAELRVKQASIIPQSNTDELDAALTALWDALVHKVAGPFTQPVSFAVDWDIYRDKLEDSLGRTGYGRYVDWYGSFGVTPKRKASDDGGRSVRSKKSKAT